MYTHSTYLGWPSEPQYLLIIHLAIAIALIFQSCLHHPAARLDFFILKGIHVQSIDKYVLYCTYLLLL